jgi:hypothetical protein
MGNSMKGKKINNNALEVIMRDVLYGMSDFTRDTSCGSQMGKLEITAVENPDRQQLTTARILPFPGPKKDSAR